MYDIPDFAYRKVKKRIVDFSFPVFNGSEGGERPGNKVVS